MLIFCELTTCLYTVNVKITINVFLTTCLISLISSLQAYISQHAYQEPGKLNAMATANKVSNLTAPPADTNPKVQLFSPF